MAYYINSKLSEWDHCIWMSRRMPLHLASKVKCLLKKKKLEKGFTTTKFSHRNALRRGIGTNFFPFLLGNWENSSFKLSLQ